MEIKNYIEKEQYKFILDNMPICCVDIILFNSKKEIILLERNTAPAKGQLWLPGGRVLKNEKLIDSAIRKVKEEVGIDIEKDKLNYFLTDETIFEDGPFDGVNTHSVNVVFYAQIDNFQNANTDKFHDRIIYINKIPDDLHPYIKNTLEIFWKEKFKSN